MPTDVRMPQMGESISEGTVTRWLKKVGETVEKDEMLFEISTDKVDAEIPSPEAGILIQVLAAEGQTVAVHSVVAQIQTGKEDESASQPGAAAKPGPVPVVRETPVRDQKEAAAGKPARRESLGKQTKEEAVPVRSSPLVKKMAAEHNVDLTQVKGSGSGGRVTKEDLLAYVEARKTAPPAAAPASASATAAVLPGRVEKVPMSTMRKRIAEHMVLSRRTSAHVTTVFTVDLTRVVGIYQKEKGRFTSQENTKLGFTPFFIRAAIDALKRFPIVNSSVSGEDILYKKDVHMGIAVALDWGLIVPVIHHADEKSFLGLARAVNDLADRARRKKLSPDEVQGGTFTITNPGALGSLFATPIINQPQVAIMGVGGVNKTPVVINDAIAIRSVVYLSLSYDHRVIDGFIADQFMASVKSYLENWEESLL